MKKFRFLAFALVAVLACVGLASCGDDDKDEPAAVGEVSAIVGTWYWDDEIEPEIYTFNADGTYTDVVISAATGDRDVYNGTYRYDAGSGLLQMYVGGELDEAWYVSINGDVMSVDDNGYHYNLYRQR